MKNCIYRFLLVVGLVLSFSISYASSLLITDIDDTLKDAHILSRWDSFGNASDASRMFLGMAELLNAVVQQNAGIQVEYVSNAPTSLMQTNHENFVSLNQFPKGGVHLRESLFEQNFKVTFIRKLLQEVRPDQVLMFGDNGEKDTVVYQTLQNEFPQIKFTILIHRVYALGSTSEVGQVIPVRQIAFLTAVDAAFLLTDIGWLPQGIPGLEQMVNEFAFETKSQPGVDGHGYFPIWGKCHDLGGVPLTGDVVRKKYWDSVVERCQAL